MKKLYKYYELNGRIDGEFEVLFGSYFRGDCAYELSAERDSLKEQGYSSLYITTRRVETAPDAEVYKGEGEAWA